MSFVGPQIPPHILAKRKRAAVEAEAARVSANTNSPKPSEDATAIAKKKRTVGPTPPLPPASLEGRPQVNPFTPSPRETPEAATATKKRFPGPAPPPAPLEERPPGSPNNDEDESSSDDAFGPSLPATSRTEEEEELEAQRRLARFQSAQKADVNDGKPKRDEWMIVPPKSEDWTAKVDPTKIKNRKFQTGKGAKAPQKSSGVNTLWTETPEEKRKRLEDEVMGRVKPATQGPPSKDNPNNAEALETARRIQEYNEKHRNKTLYEEHSAQARFEEDDPSKRAFDREKDIAGGRQITNQQKREMLTRAADFGSRFSSGNYL